MSNKNLIFIILIACFSCNYFQPNNDVYYIITKNSLIDQQNKNQNVPPAFPPPFYGSLNFILTDSFTVFFHRKHKKYDCGTGVDFTKPPRLYLEPDSLRKLNLEELSFFLDSLNIDSLSKNRWFYATLSSPTDTIKFKTFKIISDFFERKKMRGYNVRKFTEEETKVIHAKILNMKYSPYHEDWKEEFDVKFNVPKYNN